MNRGNDASLAGEMVDQAKGHAEDEQSDAVPDAAAIKHIGLGHHEHLSLCDGEREHGGRMGVPGGSENFNLPYQPAGSRAAARPYLAYCGGLRLPEKLGFFLRSVNRVLVLDGKMFMAIFLGVKEVLKKC